MASENYPIAIPEPKKLKKYLKKYSTKEVIHEGLRCATASTKHRRHHRNAYILLVGQTGAGKSTTINKLFNQNLTETGDYESTTSEITEYAAPVKAMNEIGVSNSEIHIIDTPGLGDTRGIEQDAKFIATLQDFMVNHPELKGCFPSALLLVAKFDDNRLQGPASPFVRMLKGIKLIEDLLIDPNHTNVVIVLTHYMHAKKKVQKDPHPNYDMIRTLVKEHVGFPNPIIVVGAENDGEEYDLEDVNGYFKLPGGEYYPYNLFDAVRKQCGIYDPMGENIIRTAFADSNALNAKVVSTMQLIDDPSNVMYSKALVELIGNQFKNSVTEVSNKLKQTWETVISASVRKTYPEALAVTQSIFHIRNIRNICDIPESTEEKVKLLKQIPQNEAVLSLLNRGLYINAPLLRIPYLVGQGYDLLKDEPLPGTILNYTDQRISPLGYLLPVELACEVLDDIECQCTIVNNKEEYVKTRLGDLGLTGSDSLIMGESGQCKPGYYFAGNTNYSMLRECRKFRLSLKERPGFSSAFTDDLKKLPKPSSSAEVVDQWKDFFQTYGTHLITEAFGGGSIEIIQDLTSALNDDFLKKMKNVESQVDTGVDISEDLPELLEGKYIFQGGDSRFHKNDFENQSSEECDTIVENWVETLDVLPTMLQTKLKLAPLSQYVRYVDAKKAADIENAISLLKKSLSNLEVVVPKDFIPPKRTDVRPLKFGDKSSCLKKGTLILMADCSSKPVEELVAGDKILDKDLNPCSVLGSNYFFLGKRNFYGFSAQSQFFTEVHIFVGPNMEFKVVSKDALLQENPVFESFGTVSEMEGQFPIITYKDRQLHEKTCQLYTDATTYPLDTPVYFLEVDSPSGTYFANGYLCRHELPPFHLWPETFECLQNMMLSPNIIMPILQEPFTPSTLSKFSKIAKSISHSISDILENEKESLAIDSQLIDQNTMEKNDVLKNLGLVLSNQSLSAFGLLLYSKCGKVLYENLDKRTELIGSSTRLNITMLQKIVEEKINMYL